MHPGHQQKHSRCRSSRRTKFASNAHVNASSSSSNVHDSKSSQQQNRNANHPYQDRKSSNSKEKVQKLPKPILFLRKNKEAREVPLKLKASQSRGILDSEKSQTANQKAMPTKEVEEVAFELASDMASQANLHHLGTEAPSQFNSSNPPSRANKFQRN